MAFFGPGLNQKRPFTGGHKLINWREREIKGSFVLLPVPQGLEASPQIWLRPDDNNRPGMGRGVWAL